MTKSNLISKITLMSFVDTSVIVTFILLIILAANTAHKDYIALQRENNDIKISKIKDQQDVQALQLKVEELSRKMAVLSMEHDKAMITLAMDNAAKVEDLENERSKLWNMLLTNSKAHVSRIKKKVSSKNPPKSVNDLETFTLNVSGYTASVRECGKSDGKTALNGRVKPRETAAISRDLQKRFANKKIYVPGHGVWLINDLMGSNRTKSLDLAMNSQHEAYKFGRKDIKITLLD